MIISVLSMIASIATAIGVIFGGIQIWLSRQQAITQFEDAVAREYREIASRLPTKALLGQELEEEDSKKSFDEFYHYIDLTNEQIFLRQKNRVRKETWLNWRDGIKSNFSRPAFKQAWNEIKKESVVDFQELRRLEKEGLIVTPVSGVFKSMGPILSQFSDWLCIVTLFYRLELDRRLKWEYYHAYKLVLTSVLLLLRTINPFSGSVILPGNSFTA